MRSADVAGMPESADVVVVVVEPLGYVGVLLGVVAVADPVPLIVPPVVEPEVPDVLGVVDDVPVPVPVMLPRVPAPAPLVALLPPPWSALPAVPVDCA